MNKSELSREIAELAEISIKDAATVLNATLKGIENGLLKDGKVVITGFGVFSVKDVAERNGRNPQTNEKMIIPAKRSPRFKAGKNLKEVVL